MNSNLHVGDRVRVRYGSHVGEVATISDITWHSNKFSTYARVRVSFEDGQCEDRGVDSLERAQDEPNPPRAPVIREARKAAKRSRVNFRSLIRDNH